MKNHTFTSSVAICIIAYVVALFAAKLSIDFLPENLSLLWKVAVADVVATVAVYGFSLAFKNSSLYDPYWSVAPPVMTLYWMLNHSDVIGQLQWVQFAVITCWAIRLTLNWLRGWEGLAHQDWRYVMLQQKNPSLYWLTNFGGIHLFPTIMVFMGMVPVYYFMVESTVNSYLLLWAGVFVSVGATLIEWIADEQMRTFRKNAAKGTFIDTGLWRFSRHPNYFGEISFWLGLWVMLMGVNPSFWWTAFGWIAMLLMFVFVSIPMMEEKNRKAKKGYERYVQQVSVLVPWFRNE